MKSSVKYGCGGILAIFVLFIFVIMCSGSQSEEEKLEAATWEIGNYVDDYGDESGEHFLKYIGEGKFSNSATENSDLTVEIGVDDNRFFFSLYEYNDDSPVKDEHFYHFKIKNEGGSESEFGTSNDLKTGQIVFVDENCIITNYSDLLKLFKSGSILSFSVKDDYSSTFHFKVNTKGFSEAFAKLNSSN